MDNQVYIKNVATLKYDPAKCTGCQLCVDVCPHGVFAMQNKRAYITNKDKCMECGACMKNCAYEAISVNTGVGCATAVVYSFFSGKEPACGCDDGCCN